MVREILHVGFSKSGSTFLQSLIKATPEVNFIYKSKRFSIQNEVPKDIRLDADLVNFESDEHILLPSYHPGLKVRGTKLSDVDLVLSNMEKQLTSPKIIVLIRNHSELIKSRYSQYIVGGGGTKRFEEFIEELNGGTKTEQDYYQNYYFEIINKIEEKFGEENLLVLLFEDLKNDDGVLSNLEDFTGLKLSKAPPSIFTRRKGLSRTGLEKIRQLNKALVTDKQDLAGNIKTRVPFFFYSNLIRACRIIDYYFGKEKITISEEIQDKIRQKFYADNRQLELYLGRSLTHLGYL